MTKTDKTLLRALLKIEAELGKAQKNLDEHTVLFSIQLDFSHIYDLFEVIISSFPIPEKNFDSLYDLLDELHNSSISPDEAIEEIELLI